jgi:hypothetical protein
MVITCATIEAAAQVLAVLIQARLQLGSDFRIAPLEGTTPLRIIILVELPADVLRQLHGIGDTTIT